MYTGRHACRYEASLTLQQNWNLMPRAKLLGNIYYCKCSATNLDYVSTNDVESFASTDYLQCLNGSQTSDFRCPCNNIFDITLCHFQCRV